MKKAAVILLAMMFALSCVLLVACNASVTEIKIKDAPSKVTQNDKIDYSAIHIVAKYNDNTEKELALTEKGVSYKAIDTSTPGDKVLSVKFGGKSAQVTITVEAGAVDVETVLVTGFSNTAGYLAYETARAEKEADEKNTEFFKGDKLYQVGTANGYKFVPTVVAIDGNLERVELPESQIVTDYVLYEKDGAKWTEVDKTNNSYLANVENNVYYFTHDAENHVFKLVVTLAEGFELIDDTLSTTVEQTFEVVDGYNVYNALGLSVLDNLNNKSWNDLKKHSYDWDNGKTLADFKDVTRVILHDNITITAEYLPDNYFWIDENEEATYGGLSYRNAYDSISADNKLKSYFKGSIKENPLGEEWEKDEDGDYSTSIQRGLYVSDGIGLSGNYLTVDYEPNYNTNGEKGLYLVYDYSKKGKTEYPESHYSIIRYEQSDETADYSATIENVYFIGQMGKTENLGLPAGLMMMSSNVATTTLSNTIGTDWFANVVVDATDYGILNINDCKLYNSFSSMVFSRRMDKINVTNSEMNAAGGPLFIIHTRTDSGESVTNTVLNVDKASKMESWLSGGEIWFEINNIPAEIIMQLTGIASQSDGVAGTHYRRATSAKDFKINIIAVVIPDPSKIFTNQNAIEGTIKIGDYTYGMDDVILDAFQKVKEISADGVTAAGNTLSVLQSMTPEQLGLTQEEYNGYVAQLQLLYGGFGMLTDLPIAPVYKSGNDYGFFDGSNFHTIDFLQQLYGGAELAQGLLKKFGQDSYAAQWNDVIGNQYLQAIAGVSPSNEAWTAGHLACWINPGGLAQKPDPTTPIKHFMVMIGEDVVA